MTNEEFQKLVAAQNKAARAARAEKIWGARWGWDGSRNACYARTGLRVFKGKVYQA